MMGTSKQCSNFLQKAGGWMRTGGNGFAEWTPEFRMNTKGNEAFCKYYRTVFPRYGQWRYSSQRLRASNRYGCWFTFYTNKGGTTVSRPFRGDEAFFVSTFDKKTNW